MNIGLSQSQLILRLPEDITIRIRSILKIVNENIDDNLNLQNIEIEPVSFFRHVL